MDFTPMEEQTAYMLVVDLLSPLVTLSPRAYQLLLTGNLAFSSSFSLLPNLLFYNTP